MRKKAYLNTLYVFRLMSSTLKGRFKPRYPDKYKGDPQNIWFRSSWERDMMNWLDNRDDIISWMSEERCVWYYNPVTKKKARYFPDFIIKYKKNDIVYEEMIEIKPHRQVTGPNPNPARRTKNWVREVQNYAINRAKWKAAETYCEDRGMSFRILSEENVSSWKRR